jgi:16S rRNA (cytosine1402-N4)-methyltransferase
MAYPLHKPVLLTEVVTFLSPAPGKRYLDATLGYAGHSLGLLKAGADIVGLDRDQDLLNIATKRVEEEGYSAHFSPVHTAFSDLSSVEGVFDGILFDLGVSSYQLDTPKRGFSFRFDAPLDMRMDQDLAVTARDLVNGLGKNELIALFSTLGEEKYAKKIAEVICDTRKEKPIVTTKQLADLVASVVPQTKTIHPATKIFQALRMAVNSEREELKAALPSALSKLAQGGILAVISFHSLEDKIIKTWINDMVEAGLVEMVTTAPIGPSTEEISANPRSRSAQLRVVRRLS